MKTILLIIITFLASVTQAAPPSAPPNVIFFLIDDLGWTDLGCYGSTFYETPHIDQLAKEGMRFTAAYSAAPVCSPSRASIMSGKNPARLGFTGHITAILDYRHPSGSRLIPPRDHMRLRLRETTIAEALKPLGYTSAHIGKWHLGTEPYWPLSQGFDFNIAGNTHGSPPTYFDPYLNPAKEWNPGLVTMQGMNEGDYLTDRLTDEAIGFITEHRNKPFFLHLSHYAVHTPLEAQQPLIDKYRAKKEHDKSQFSEKYAAMIESVDISVGRILATLKKLKLDDHTLVIFFSDNGGLASSTNNAPLRAGKQTLYEGGIRVPLIIKWPGQTAPGSTNHTPVHSDDLMPTITHITTGDAAHPTPEHQYDGQSLVPLLTGREGFATRPLYWYYPHYAKRPGAVLRVGDYKLIEFYDPPAVELYNIASDLSEVTDLAGAMPGRVKQMREQLANWLVEIDAITHTANPEFKVKR